MEAVKINTKEKERTKVTYHKSVFSSVLTGITWGAAILALAVLVFLVGFILIRGVKNLTLEQFAWTYNTENVTPRNQHYIIKFAEHGKLIGLQSKPHIYPLFYEIGRASCRERV